MDPAGAPWYWWCSWLGMQLVSHGGSSLVSAAGQVVAVHCDAVSEWPKIDAGSGIRLGALVRRLQACPTLPG